MNFQRSQSENRMNSSLGIHTRNTGGYSVLGNAALAAGSGSALGGSGDRKEPVKTIKTIKIETKC